MIKAVSIDKERVELEIHGSMNDLVNELRMILSAVEDKAELRECFILAVSDLHKEFSEEA